MSFRVESVHFDDRSVELWRDTWDPEGNFFTIIIGRNGTGKSRLLAAIARLFLEFERGLSRSSSNSVWSGLTGLEVECVLSDQRFRLNSDSLQSPSSILRRQDNSPNVIGTTIGPFDKFPIRRSSTDFRIMLEQFLGKQTRGIYHYLGTKNQFGKATQTSQLGRVIDSLVDSLGDDHKKHPQLRRVFEFLELRPEIQASFRIPPKWYDQLWGRRAREGGRASLQEAFWQNLSEEKREEVQSVLRNKELPFLEFFQHAIEEVQENLIRSTRTINVSLNFGGAPLRRSVRSLSKKLSFLRHLGIVTLRGFLLFRKKGEPESFNINDASSGQQAVILTILGLAGEITSNSLVLIDEPETSLHPEWQEKFVDLLTHTFSNSSGCHFVLATHSPLIVSRIGSTNATILDLDENVLLTAEQYSRGSADYQLAEVFKTPGNRNEYLVRKGLTFLTRIGSGIPLSSKDKSDIHTLLSFKNRLDRRDPVRELLTALDVAVNQLKNDN